VTSRQILLVVLALLAQALANPAKADEMARLVLPGVTEMVETTKVAAVEYISERRFDFVGATVRVVLQVEGAGVAIDLGPRLGPLTTLSTRATRGGRVMVPEGVPLILTFTLRSDGYWTWRVVAQDSSLLGEQSGRLTGETLAGLRATPVVLRASDNQGLAPAVLAVLAIAGPGETDTVYETLARFFGRVEDAEQRLEAGETEAGETMLREALRALDAQALSRHPLDDFLLAASAGLIKVPEGVVERLLQEYESLNRAAGLASHAGAIRLYAGLLAARAGRLDTLKRLAADGGTPLAQTRVQTLAQALLRILKGDVQRGYDAIDAAIAAGDALDEPTVHLLTRHVAVAAPFYADTARARTLLGTKMPVNVPGWRR